MLEIFLSSVLPAFLIVGIGVLLGPLVGSGIVAVNRLVLYAAAPALVLTALVEADLVLSNVIRLYSGHLLFVAAMFVLARGLTWRVERRASRGFAATAMFSNAANLMLPISLFALGALGLERAVLLFVLLQFLMYTLVPLVLVGRDDFAGRSLLGLLRLPVLWAVPVGIVLNLLSVPPPTGIWRGVSLLSDAAIPLILLILGLQVYRSGLRPPTGLTWAATLLKLVVGPPVAYALGWLVGARELDLAVLTLLGAMPPAVNILILSLEFGGDVEGVARTVVLGTLGAMLTLPVVLFLVG